MPFLPPWGAGWVCVTHKVRSTDCEEVRMTLDTLYRTALAVSAALQARFGKRAGDARYDCQQQGWTPGISAACDAWAAAQDAWTAAYCAATGEGRI
jgi:hypothetical protein